MSYLAWDLYDTHNRSDCVYHLVNKFVFRTTIDISNNSVPYSEINV